MALLRKKDIDNMSEYLARKEERIQRRKGKGLTSSLVKVKTDSEEQRAKRPKLDACSANGK